MSANPPGVMDGKYGKARSRKGYARWRYRTRAEFAAHEYRTRRPHTSKIRVLEFGAADGRTLLALRDLLGVGNVYDGIEFSQQLLSLAPELPQGVRLLQGDVTELPSEMRSEQYDLVVALAVLEHLPSPEQALEQALEALRPGGVFVASCPHPSWDEIAGRLGLVPDEHHEGHLDHHTLQQLAQGAGFADCSVTRFMSLPIAALPYVGLSVPPKYSLKVDRFLAQFSVTSPIFVNQGLIATKAIA